MFRKATIKDVARAAKVSTATVSRVLKNADLVKPATRERVLKAVARVNYTPNVLGRNLRRQETRAVFLLVRDMRNPFYLEVFQGLEAEARAGGYNVLMGNIENSLERELEYLRLLRARHADGMMLMTGQLPEDAAREIQSEELPVVVALEYFRDYDLPTVRIDNPAAAKKAVEHLLDLGHTRIGHITGPTPEIMSLDRHQGYEEALKDRGLTPDPGFTAWGDFTLDSGRAACRRIFSGEHHPTALFCSNDEMAIGAIHELRDMGLKVPSDVSVMGFDDISFAAACYPPLSTIRQPRQEIGHRAMRLLIDLMAGRKVPKKPVVMPTELIVRGSTDLVAAGN